MNRWFPIALFAGVLAIPAAAAAIDGSTPTVTKVVTTSGAAATESAATASDATESRAAERPATEPAPVKAIRAKAPATGHVERVLAGQKCREKSFEDAAEFRFEYGRGPASMQRCIGQEIREARFSCRQEALEDPADYRSEFGIGAAARVRCVRHELT
jgi:hypothetical protein